MSRTLVEADEPAPAAEFRIGRAGRFILVPVRLGERTCSMLVDTGCTLTGFDVTLRDQLGQSIGEQALVTPAGPLVAPLYTTPDATVGTLSLKHIPQVFAHDFGSVREASGEQIHGILGTDFLSAWIVQIDFDNGRLRLFAPETDPQRDWGRAIQMFKDPKSRPCVIGRAGDSLEVSWLIDTGASGMCVRPELFDRLVREGAIQRGPGFASLTGAGQLEGASGRLTQVDLGDFRHLQLRCDRARPSALGLNYLARYTLTLDMPRMTAYFRPGANFEKPEPTATSGLQLKRIDGKTLVSGLKPESAATRAGLEVGDELVSINKRPIHEYDFFELRMLLTSRVGLKIPVTVRRGTQLLDSRLELDAVDPVPEK